MLPGCRAATITPPATIDKTHVRWEGAMWDHGNGEIRRHGTIGGIVAMFLISVELAAHWWAHFQENKPVWQAWAVAIAALFVGFFVAFYLIELVELTTRKLQNRKPILIEDIEGVNGIWIDAIVEGTEIIRSAKITIASTVGTGFSVEGDSFEVDKNLVVGHAKCGGFTSVSGTGVPLGSKSIAYSYAGDDKAAPPDARRHGGIVYYDFAKVTARTIEGKETAVKYFSGAFLERGTMKVYLVFGMKLPDETLDSDVHAKMQEFVNRPDVREFAATGKPPLTIFPVK
jgi:hypothetical protein